MIKLRPIYSAAAAAGALLFLGAGCEPPKDKEFVRPKAVMTFKAKDMADSLHAVIAAGREVHAREITHRLAYELRALKTSETWREDKALPAPCQLLRWTPKTPASRGVEFAYTLRSLWAVSKKGAPETAVERKGLQFVAEHPGQNYYADEQLGGRHYFTGDLPRPRDSLLLRRVPQRQPALSPSGIFGPGT